MGNRRWVYCLMVLSQLFHLASHAGQRIGVGDKGL